MDSKGLEGKPEDALLLFSENTQRMLNRLDKDSRAEVLSMVVEFANVIAMKGNEPMLRIDVDLVGNDHGPSWNVLVEECGSPVARFQEHSPSKSQLMAHIVLNMAMEAGSCAASNGLGDQAKVYAEWGEALREVHNFLMSESERLKKEAESISTPAN